MPEDAVLCEVREAARKARRSVFVSGNFNILHPGHLRLLQFAAESGDFLVVGITGDGASGVTIPEELRLEGVKAISVVNYAFILREPVEAFVGRFQPAVVVKGKEHENLENPEQAVLDSYGGKLLFSSGEVRFSSMDLLRREYLETNFSAIVKPLDFPQRHGFTLSGLKQQLAKLNGLNVLVVGDLIVDEYIDCEPVGMSQEDPTIVVTPIETKRFVGGASIVAAHARGLGAQVHYFSVAGVDEPASFAADKLKRYGVEFTMLPDESRPTTLKQRYRASGKTLLRVSQMRQHAIRPDVSRKILDAVRANIERADLLIFSDFNYGCLPQDLVDKIVKLCTARGVPMVADSQASSQTSDVSRFRGMKLLTPTEREARLALGDWNSGLVVVAEKLRVKAGAESIVVTLGAEGVMIHAKNAVGVFTDRLPALNTVPRDSAGAGDSFLTCSAMALCAGMDIWQSTYLGSLAAACQVSRVGNTPLTQNDLVAEIDYP